MPVFERIFVAAQLEEAALTTLQKWMPTYIKEVERQLGLVPTLKPPQLYSNRNSFDVLPGEKWPLCVAISPGTEGQPMMNGARKYTAFWRLGIGVAFPMQTEREANLAAKIYGAAVRGVMSQKGSLGGVVENTRWADEAYDDLPLTNQNMVYKSATTLFSVEVQDVVTAIKGPDEPDHDPYVWGLVEKVIIDLVKEPIDAVL